MKKLVIALLCCMATGAALAADWSLISERGGVEEYADFKNAVTNGDMRQVWTLYNFKDRTIRMNKSGDSKNPEYVIAKSIMGYREVDCKNRRYRMMESRGFDGLMTSGKQIATFVNKEVVWNKIDPNSFEEAVFKGICGK